MTQPTPYTPTTDFSGDELTNTGGRSTVRTAALDAEFSALAATTAGILGNLALNQRDDGEIRDGRVKLHTLASDVKALLAVSGATIRGAWAAATTYAIRDVVTQGGATYISAVAHTAGAVFATDLAAGKWLLLALQSAATAAGTPFVATGTISSVNVQAAIEELDADARALLSSQAADLASTAVGKGAALVGLPSTGSAGTVAAALSGVVWLNALAGVDPTGATDSTAAIASALATGKDVVGYGTFKVGATLTMSSTQGQRLIIRGSMRPTHRGDTIRIVAFEQAVDVAINGADQAASGTTGSAIVVGYGGANAQQASVARSRVINYAGNALLWEQGSMLDMTSFHAQSCSGDGILCTANYDDNNHGLFNNTHIISCAGVGYNIPSNGTFGSALNSRSHVFTNAKAFGCGRNFYIDTINNVGSVFSELGTNPDQFGTLSAGNEICLIETVTAFANWQDNSVNGINALRGYSIYNQMEHRKIVAQSVLVQNQAEGRQALRQTGARAFSDTIEATTGAVTVTHAKGTASKRTDVFEDRLQLAGGMVISQGRTGTITPTVGALAAGAGTTVTVAAATSGAATGDTAMVTLSIGGTSGAVQATCNIEPSGDLTIVLQNVGGSSVTLGSVTIRWAVFKHTA